MDGSEAFSRRTVLRAGAGAAALGVAGAGTAAAQEFGGWFDDVPNYDGVEDRTGQSEVTVEVGVTTENGPFGFGPAAIRIDPGTTINFEWVSNQHNILFEEKPSGAAWEGISTLHDTGYADSHTFETEGTYTYYCEPHRQLGMKGAIVVGGEGGGGNGGGKPGFDGWLDDVPNYDQLADQTGTDATTVEVGVDTANGPFGFGPAAVQIDPGTTIDFEWVSNQHNVLFEEKPEGATWEGIPDLYDSGHSDSHTFETEGVYKYYCEPHRQLGMKGVIVVGDVLDGGNGNGGTTEPPGGHGGGGGGLFDQPESLLTLGGAIALGVLSPIIFALFLRSRGDEADV